MESKYHYFKRDISWLSFNYRVLLEADDDSLPLYERINFISIYSSNLEEFYKIRVAEHKAIASGGQSDDMTQEEARHLIHQITEAVNSQMEDRIRIYEHKIVPALRRHHIIFYQSKQEVEPFHHYNYLFASSVSISKRWSISAAILISSILVIPKHFLPASFNDAPI